MNDVTEHKDPMVTFQEKVVEKLRADIGEMLPDDALSKLVQRAVDEQFFKERSVENRFSGRELKPSWFVEEVAKIAKPIIADSLNKHVEDHRAEIEKAISDFLDSQNLTLLTVAAMQSATTEQISAMAMQIVSQIRNNY